MRPEGPPGVRLDQLLVDLGLARGRGEARTLIEAGRVAVDGSVVWKPGKRVSPATAPQVDYPPHRYVSRGGRKLERALDVFQIGVAGTVCLDVGASTGGFTDCLLERGARLVYAVDVGYGLLDWRLRSDPRVVAIDRANARHLTRDDFERRVRACLAKVAGRGDAGTGFPWPALATCDVSFISLLKVVPAVGSLLEAPRNLVLLVKPQFEAGRGKVGSKGVVRDPAIHVEVLETVIGGLESRRGPDGDRSSSPPVARVDWVVRGLTFSPIRGPEGNIEYLLWATGYAGEGTAADRAEGRGEMVRKAVEEAFRTLR